MRIGRHNIGPTWPTADKPAEAARVLVIAEIGVNHDGRLDRALQLVEIAARCGCDAVKLQVFRAAQLMHPSGRLADYQQGRVSETDPVSMLRKYELSEAELAEVVAQIRRLGLEPVATPFSPGDVDTLGRLGVSAVKIASPDVINLPLLRRAALLGKPMLISTGATNLDEIDRAVAWLDGMFADYALLHCVSSYPAPDEQLNLGWITRLAERYGDRPVGYSDHGESELAGACAVSAGALIVERHLTFDRSASGPDHAASSDEAGMARYVQMIRRAQAMTGVGHRRVLPVERDVREVSRQSLVWTRNLPAGHCITPADMTTMRPGVGVSAALHDTLIDQMLLRPVRAGDLVDPALIAGDQPLRRVS